MNSNVDVLLIGENEDILSYLSASLTSHGYQVTMTLQGNEGLRLAATRHPDVVLLDLGPSDLDDCALLKRLRSLSLVPIIVLSACDGEREKVTALDMGADDYMTKPVGLAELMARIRSSLRRSARLPRRRYKALDLSIDFQDHSVWREGNRVHLTQVEYQLLSLLAQNSGRVLSCRFIMDELWGSYVSGSNPILRVNVANLRRKIEPDPSAPQYLFTEVGIGYRMRENEMP